MLDDDEMCALLEVVCGHRPRGPSASSASDHARGAWSFIPGASGLGGFWVTCQLLSSPTVWDSAMAEASTEDSKAPRAGGRALRPPATHDVNTQLLAGSGRERECSECRRPFDQPSCACTAPSPHVHDLPRCIGVHSNVGVQSRLLLLFKRDPEEVSLN